MQSQENSDRINILSIILIMIGAIFIVSMISKLVKDIKKTTSSDIVSEEGQEILQDPKKRQRLREAIDHYHQEGNWDKLSDVTKTS